MIIIIKLVSFVQEVVLTDWLQGKPNIPDQLKKFPISKHISQVQIAEKEEDIIPLASQYSADVIMLYSTRLSNPIKFLSECLRKLPDTRLVVIDHDKNQQVIDFCIDNGIYDIGIGGASAIKIQKMIVDGYSKEDIINFRSTSAPVVLAESVDVTENKPAIPQRIERNETTTVIALFSMKSIGKTSTALNTAIAMAAAGLKVAVVDQNTLTPDLGAYVGIQRGVAGIERVYSGAHDIQSVDQLIHTMHGIDIIPMGSSQETAALNVSTQRIEQFIQYMSAKNYDVIIFDLSSDIDMVSNRYIIKRADKVILVVNQLPESVENMRNQINRIQNFCDRSSSDMGLVINCYQDSSIAPAKIEAYLGISVIGKIPVDNAGFSHSTKSRTPYIINFPKKSGPFDQLAVQLAGSGPLATDKSKGSGLFGKLRNLVLNKKKGGNEE